MVQDKYTNLRVMASALHAAPHTQVHTKQASAGHASEVGERLPSGHAKVKITLGRGRFSRASVQLGGLGAELREPRHTKQLSTRRGRRQGSEDRE